MENLTPNQSAIIGNLISEFSRMNTASVPTTNPLFELYEEFNADKKEYEEQVKIGNAKSQALGYQVQSDLNRLNDYFKELGLGLNPKFSSTNNYDGLMLEYKVNSATMLQVHGFVSYNFKKLGSYTLPVNHKIEYELGYRTIDTHNSIESLIGSDDFKDKVKKLLKVLSQF